MRRARNQRSVAASKRSACVPIISYSQRDLVLGRLRSSFRPRMAQCREDRVQCSIRMMDAPRSATWKWSIPLALHPSFSLHSSVSGRGRSILFRRRSTYLKFESGRTSLYPSFSPTLRVTCAYRHHSYHCQEKELYLYWGNSSLFVLFLSLLYTRRGRVAVLL